MAKNNGKQFENKIREAIERVPFATVDRIPDQVSKFKGSTNICDFIAYQYPTLFYLECKSVHGNTLSIHSVPKMGKDGKLHGFYGDIRDNQWEGLLEKSKYPGVITGIICWWIDHDETWFIPMWILEDARNNCHDKSINLKHPLMQGYWTYIPGVKKRTYFDYDIETLMNLKKEANYVI